mmetsp:Transcript_20593/g.43766  ORF Transcript_20593/g.43766 Transcript_20593/m.43766 type:complete len:299 (+) Transcript_20593:2-898(+)
MPIQKIKPRAPEEWELRVIIWCAQNIPKDVDFGGLSDPQVICQLGEDRQETDTHFRAKNGKASWNWRLKFPVTMSSSMKFQRLQVQMWDKDLLTSNDMIGEATLKLDQWFHRVYRRRQKLPNYWDAEADPQIKPYERGGSWFDSLSDAVEGFSAGSPLLGGQQEDDPQLESCKFCIPLHDNNRDLDGPELSKGDKAFKENPPVVVMSLQLVPGFMIDKLPAGQGRSDPNVNPVLPKPVGRLRFTLNPISMLFQLVGPEVARKICAFLAKLLCCAICVLLTYYTVPVVIGNVVSQPFTG